ncbi:MAG: M48 family metalloprotease [Alphaproteobacteria bacterium]
MRRIRFLFTLLLGGVAGIAAAALPVPAAAQSFIRDTEIENTIRVYLAPLYQAADLDAAAVNVYLINDPRLNAFVTGGQRIFIHTGLLQQTTTPGQVIGVLAHELGHIAGGHLIRIKDAMRGATAQSIVTMVLGGAAAIAAGRPDGIQAAVGAGATVQQRLSLQYTRAMEQSADQAALTYLDRTGQSARGMLETMEILDQQAKMAGNLDPYMVSHPLTADRLRHIRNHVEQSRFSDAKPDPRLVEMEARMRGKLNGYLDPPERTLAAYAATDTGIEARYARAIALSKAHDLKASLAVVDDLLAERPEDPFIHELKGDILRDAGRIEDSRQSYEKAVAIIPWAALIRVNLARSQLDLNTPDMDRAALANLREAVRFEREMPSLWRLMATAQGRLGNQGMTAIALAEEAVLRGDTGVATRQAERAVDQLPEGSEEWLRAQDIINAMKKRKKKDD